MMFGWDFKEFLVDTIEVYSFENYNEYGEPQYSDTGRVYLAHVREDTSVKIDTQRIEDYPKLTIFVDGSAQIKLKDKIVYNDKEYTVVDVVLRRWDFINDLYYKVVYAK